MSNKYESIKYFDKWLDKLSSTNEIIVQNDIYELVAKSESVIGYKSNPIKSIESCANISVKDFISDLEREKDKELQIKTIKTAVTIIKSQIQENGVYKKEKTHFITKEGMIAIKNLYWIVGVSFAFGALSSRAIYDIYIIISKLITLK